MGLLRRRWLWLVLLLVVVVVTVALVALPEIIRRVAVSRITKMTGRAVAIDDVDLNVFTGRVALKGFRLAQRGSNEPALEFTQVAVQVAPLALIRSHARVVDLTVIAPHVHVTRTDPTTFDFSDLLELIPPADPRKPSRTIVTIEKLTVRDGLVVARDRVPSPPGEWRLEALTVDGGGITTAAGAAPGHLAVSARLNGAEVALNATALALQPLGVDARVTVTGVRLAPLTPYVPAEIRALPGEGVVGTTLTLKASRGSDGKLGGAVAGDVSIDGLALVQRERPDPIATVKRLGVTIKQADIATRAVTIGAIEVDTLALNATRAADGTIDLLALIPGRAAPQGGAGSSTPPAGAPAGSAAAASRTTSAPVPPATAAQPPAAATASGPAATETSPAVSLVLERLALKNGTVRFRDEHVKPVTTLTVSDLNATVRDVTWPATRPAALDIAMALPDKGHLTVTGTATPAPLDADITMTMRGASIAPYAAYFPFRARFTGLFNGDSRSQVKVVDGVITAASKGQSVIENLAVVDPGRPAGTTPPMRIPRVSISGLDFVWPKYARIARLVITRPDLRLERAADGSIPLRQILQPPGAEGATPRPESKGTASKAPARVTQTASRAPAKTEPKSPPTAASASSLPLAIEIGQIVIEDGVVRFQDRTTRPPFSESISKLALNVEGVSSAPGRRAKLRVQGIVGGSSALDLRGEVAPFGTLYADLVGELRDFTLPSVNPYADRAISWIIQRGRLAARVQVKLQGDELTARNEMVVADLTVAPSQQSDEVKKRLGLPLGLIVSLIKDGQGQIKINVPITGHLNDPKFDLSETIWTAIKNVLVNVLKAPFRAIGRLFTGSDNTIENLAVEPVTFEAGSADVPPPMEQHIVQIAGFLRGAPGIALALTPVVTAKDVESLRGQELTARLQKLQRDRKLPSYPAAVTAEFRARFPDVKPPEVVEQQLARLLAEEPVPEARLKELQSHRLETVRTALTKNEGITETRLRAGEPKAGVDPAGEGRVEFTFAP